MVADLPDSYSELRDTKLREEIQLLRTQVAHAKAAMTEEHSGLKLWKAFQATIAVAVAVVPLWISASSYIDTQKEAQTFKLRQETVELLKLLSSGNPTAESGAAIAFVVLGSGTLPFLIENLRIEHNKKVYETIHLTIEMIVKSEKDDSKRIAILCDAYEQLSEMIATGINKIKVGALSVKEGFRAQLRTLLSLESLAKRYDASRIKPKSSDFSAQLKKIKSKDSSEFARILDGE